MKTNIQHFLPLFLITLIVSQFFLILFFKGSALLDKYDVDYWKDRYEHSQYVLPLSKRIIGDDGLYAYAGYRLINGDDSFSINVDKPPAGKYLIGVSIKLFNNPIYGSLIVGLLTLYLYFGLVYIITKDRFWSLFTTLLLFLDPLFFSQMSISNLDIYQLFFLMLNLVFVFKILTAKKTFIGLAFFAGLALGFFVETKPPILLPILFTLETFLFLSRLKKKFYALFIIGIIIGVLIPYIQYVRLGHSFMDILKVHKYIFFFYQQSKLSIHTGAIIQALLIGKFPHITDGFLLPVREWSVLWPIVTFLSIYSGFTAWKVNNYIWKNLILFAILSLIIYSFIPSYPRYLLTILPFLYLFAVKFIKENLKFVLKNYIPTILIVFGFINSFSFLQQPADIMLNNFFYNFENQYFQDIYQGNIDVESQGQISKSDFNLLAKKVFEDAEIRAITITEQNRKMPRFFGTNGEVNIKVEYATQDLGIFSEIKKLLLVKQMNEWKVKWEWNLLVDGYKPGYKIEKKIETGKRGSLIGKKGPIAQDEQSYLISVNPALIDLKREEEMLRLIGYFGDQSWLNLQNGYLENVLPNTYVPLVTAFRPIDDESKKQLLSYPGVALNPSPGRIYYYHSEPKDIKNVSFNECCTRIYSSTNYHGISGLEKIYEPELTGGNGGELLLVDSDSRVIKTILKKDVKSGRDIVIN